MHPIFRTVGTLIFFSGILLTEFVSAQSNPRSTLDVAEFCDAVGRSKEFYGEAPAACKPSANSRKSAVLTSSISALGIEIPKGAIGAFTPDVMSKAGQVLVPLSARPDSARVATEALKLLKKSEISSVSDTTAHCIPVPEIHARNASWICTGGAKDPALVSAMTNQARHEKDLQVGCDALNARIRHAVPTASGYSCDIRQLHHQYLIGTTRGK